jgi:hypothetical protein
MKQLMEINLNMLAPESIKLITFNGSTMTVLLKGDSEVVIKFKDRDHMAKALAAWAKQPKVANGLTGGTPLSVADSSEGRIYHRPDAA